jgi:hypothetical protein
MKKFILSATVLMMLFFSSFSQTNSISNDTIIIKILHYLPKGWFIYEKENQLIFEKQDTVWVLNENHKNASSSIETKEEKIARIKKSGKPDKSKIIYQFEKKWSQEKIKQELIENDTLYKEIRRLPKKYNIEDLRDKVLSSRQGDVYVGKTDKEKQSINLYEKEKILLMKKVNQVPDFNTENFSITFLSASGCFDDFHVVVPEEISFENYQIRTLFYEYAQNIHNVR